jgi:hypothetical protein
VFEGSDYMIWIAKKLVAEKRIPNVKPGKVLPPATASVMQQFYILMKSAGSCQRQKVMSLLTQKARKFIFRQKRVIIVQHKSSLPKF